ncbi:MAG: hypothetical protein Fur0037_04930 [Planctomycetota bacterium]
MTVVLENLSIRYGSLLAVDRVSVRFSKGVVGLLGRNGAGKSSILKALLGLVPPAGGSMRVLDLPPGASSARIREVIGYMPERDCYVSGLNGYETVAILGRLSGLPPREAARRAHEVLYLVGLEEQRYRPVAGYSTGMRQKVKLAASLVHDPAVVFLDEPTSGLDPDGRKEMLALVRQLGGDLGKSIILSTHILQDVEAVCSDVVLLDKGRVVASGGIRELTAGMDRVYHLDVEPPDLDLRRDGVLRFQKIGSGSHRVSLPEGRSVADLFACVRQAGGAVRRLQLHRLTLEDVFLSAVARGEAGAGLDGSGGGGTP